MTQNLMQCHRQWASRPVDERFVSLEEMLSAQIEFRKNSAERVVSMEDFRCVGSEGDEVQLVGKAGVPYTPTHYSFGQLAARCDAPASYLRKLPATLAADCLNNGLGQKKDEVQLLLNRSGNALCAITGAKYGRIWDNEITSGLLEFTRRNPDWKIPGEFGKQVQVTRENTTLYASDHDMFVFLADEENRIEFPNRREGKTGSLARGFFISNSMVGDAKLKISMFLFDYACSNRIVWGAENYQEISFRHSKHAPERFIQEAAPALSRYKSLSLEPIETALGQARLIKLTETDVNKILEPIVGVRAVEKVKIQHQQEEFRPIETVWDVSTGLTAYAREIPYQDQRVLLEQEAGKILGKFLPKNLLALPSPTTKVVVSNLDF